ncbi:hypothetical protein T4D_12028 [Trichinella pseudospiralis]|uniref:Uncharacterized protein n=1 Tax=Trichinella pseudospiralis TaxID=6337 RepID=A0A0V1F462_TRIPS|nr:hypothetical protein T4D_12028 [Trichinella pseudospiralis]
MNLIAIISSVVVLPRTAVLLLQIPTEEKSLSVSNRQYDKIFIAFWSLYSKDRKEYRRKTWLELLEIIEDTENRNTAVATNEAESKAALIGHVSFSINFWTCMCSAPTLCHGVITGGTLRASRSGKRPHVLVFLLGPDGDLKVELSYCF